jgi:hypothetical protein
MRGIDNEAGRLNCSQFFVCYYFAIGIGISIGTDTGTQDSPCPLAQQQIKRFLASGEEFRALTFRI